MTPTQHMIHHWLKGKTIARSQAIRGAGKALNTAINPSTISAQINVNTDPDTRVRTDLDAGLNRRRVGIGSLGEVSLDVELGVEFGL